VLQKTAGREEPTAQLHGGEEDPVELAAGEDAAVVEIVEPGRIGEQRCTRPG
jgi:hypothetical protein